MSIVSLVKGCPLFHEIYDKEIEQILKQCSVASFKKDEVIIQQNDTSSDIGIILAGAADILVEKNGKEQFIVSIGQGDLFGELVLINELKRTATIRATKNTDILIISYDNFYSFYSKKPAVFALMVLNLTRLITKRLKSANTLIENLSKEMQDLKKSA
ncbi:MAG: cyclic nucleotide-binding domain-containing protein [Halobacteriovoraceae bacterium]|nr:cyclic nucleotide-binding domain-containing protein [Halobacteriovoraceae bacterium]